MPMGILERFVETITATGVKCAYGVVRDSLNVLMDPLKQVVWILRWSSPRFCPRAQQSDESQKQLQQLKQQDEQVAKRSMGHAVSR
jgi:hypothetical protein